MSSKGASSPAIAALPNFDPVRKARLLDTLGARGDQAALIGIIDQLKSTDVTVSEAALNACSELGDADTVKMMLSLSSIDSNKVGQALSKMADPGVNQALTSALKDDSTRMTAIRAIQARQLRGSRSHTG